MPDYMILLGICISGILGYALSKGIVAGLNIVDKAITERGADHRIGRIMNVLAGFSSILAYLACRDMMGGLVGCMFWASLSAAAYSDRLTNEIYDWVYFPGISACMVMMAIQKPDEGVIVDLIVFLVLQAVLFRHMYGGSDCIAFSMCAMFLALYGYGLLEQMLMMLLTLVLFTIWQGMNRNIHVSRKSIREHTFFKLKQPDAMIPHIALSMSIIMLYMSMPLIQALR